MIAGCSSDKSPSAANGGGGHVTITHIFGETSIAEPPKRVVSAGFTGQDDLLALGIVPIAVTNWFGDQPFGVWPWAQPKLGNAKPVVLNLDNGIQLSQISGLKPDLIVATDAGLDQDTYQKLAAIAPTLAQSDGDAFFEPWKDQAKAIGQAVFQSGQMASLISGVDKGFAAVADKYQQFKNKRVLLLQGRLHERECRGDHRLANRLPHPDGAGHPGEPRLVRQPTRSARSSRARRSSQSSATPTC